jgi:hypothetical protein
MERRKDKSRKQRARGRGTNLHVGVEHHRREEAVQPLLDVVLARVGRHEGLQAHRHKHNASEQAHGFSGGAEKKREKKKREPVG